MNHLTRTTSKSLGSLDTVQLDRVADSVRRLTEKHPPLTAEFTVTDPPHAALTHWAAIGHVCHPARGESTIPQPRHPARYVARDVRLKSQSGNPPRPA